MPCTKYGSTQFHFIMVILFTPSAIRCRSDNFSYKKINIQAFKIYIFLF
jgi:hypothetical protein